MEAIGTKNCKTKQF